MPNAVHKHAAHLVVAARVLAIPAVVWLFSMPALWPRVAAFVLLILAVALDGLDGYLARRYGTSSDVGGLLDTLGDRITENVLLVFFAFSRLIPVGIALFFVIRSLIADFVRALNFQNGIGTFAINTSFWGRIFVASTFSRALYLVVKCLLFVCGGVVCILRASTIAPDDPLLVNSELGTYYLAYLALLFNAVRFIFLLYDSRKTIRDRFAS